MTCNLMGRILCPSLPLLCTEAIELTLDQHILIIWLTAEQEQNELDLMSSWAFEKCNTSHCKYDKNSRNNLSQCLIDDYIIHKFLEELQSTAAHRVPEHLSGNAISFYFYFFIYFFMVCLIFINIILLEILKVY